MNDREPWNRCRYVEGDPHGHYESYFQRANHPERPLAFWIRYTVFSPKGRPGDAVGELWAIYFDGERNSVTAVKQVVPIRDCRFAQQGLDVRMGEASLTAGLFEGRAHSGGNALQWDLRYNRRFCFCPNPSMRADSPKPRHLSERRTQCSTARFP